MGEFYPIYLSLKDKKCLVVGGGKIAERKVQSLLACGAKIFIVSPHLTPILKEQVQKNEIIYYDKEYTCTDLEGAILVIGATDKHEINIKVAQDCKEKNILVNIVDNPELCNFYVPAVVKRGDLSIGISTGGKSPMLARKIREQLDKTFGSEYEKFLDLMGDLRKDIIASTPDNNIRKKAFEMLVESDILDLLAEGNDDMVKGRVNNVLSNCGLKS